MRPLGSSSILVSTPKSGGDTPCLVVYALVVRVLRKNFVVLVNRGKF